MKSGILKLAGMAFLLAGISGVMMAQTDNGFRSPEIDAASAGTAGTLLSGALLMIRSRKK